MVINDQVKPGSRVDLEVSDQDVSKRLDLFLAQSFVLYSRSFFKRLIDDGAVLINMRASKSGYILRAGDRVQITFPELPKPGLSLDAFDKRFAVTLVAQEPDFLIICKPAGLMVHKPAKLSKDVTLVDWLLASYADLKHVGIEDRPGIIHRLDKDTSGLLIIPRTNEAFGLFGTLFRSRKIDKIYWAVVKGHPDKSGVIDFPIGRDPVHKCRMIHMPGSGPSREALTSFQVLNYYQEYSLVEVRLVTGRTHQIRVHFAAIGHPVLGDVVYGVKSPLIDRQALHAKKIAFCYKDKLYEFDFPIATDIQKLIDAPTI